MGKKKKLSPEEKLALKLEMERKAIEEQRMVYLKQLSREVKTTKMNWKNIRKDFRKMMMKFKLPAMQREAEVAWHHFEHTIDLKDFVIKSLNDALQEDNVQTEHTLEVHVEAIDNLLRVLHERLSDEESRYKKNLATLLQESQSKVTKTIQTDTSAEEWFSIILYVTDNRHEEWIRLKECETVPRLNDETDKFKNLQRAMCGKKESVLQDTWELIKKTLVDHEEATEKTRKEYIRLKQRDERASEVIYRQLIHTQKLYERIRRLRERLQSLQPELALSALLEERKFFLDAFCELRDRLRMERKRDMKQLLTLTAESNLSLTWLKNLVEKGERILKLASICQKLETQEEKVTPLWMKEKESAMDAEPQPSDSTFCIDLLYKPEKQKKPCILDKPVGDRECEYEAEDSEESSSAKETPVVQEETDKEVAEEIEEEEIEEDIPLLNMYKDMNFLETFWRRVGLVHMSYNELYYIREELVKENQALQNMLYRYMNDVSAKQFTQIVSPNCEMKWGPPNNIIEASHIVKKLMH